MDIAVCDQPVQSSGTKTRNPGGVSSLTNAFYVSHLDERNRRARQFICKGRWHKSRRPFALRDARGTPPLRQNGVRRQHRAMR